MAHRAFLLFGDGRFMNVGTDQWDRATSKTEKIENAAQRNRDELVRFGTALLFVVDIMLFTIVRTDGGIDGTLLVAAAMIGGYMAMNIGVNDVANNVGPAVGSKAISLFEVGLLARHQIS
ncbi:hypothetical protein [Yoonia sediminilitoris]|nr:hypothetical protein [Yoonia sediminilitoris]